MHRSHSNSRHALQSVSAPALRYDGPQSDELQAAKVQSRFRFSRETAAEIARLAYGISEKLERRASW